jgi:hypothetical protein
MKCFRPWAACFLLAVSAGAAPAEDRAGVAFFEEHVRPLFAEHCYRCHSRQAKTFRGGLRLDSKAGWTKGGDSGPALVPVTPTAAC